MNKKTAIAAFAVFGAMQLNAATAEVIAFDDLGGTTMPGASNTILGMQTTFNDYVTATAEDFIFAAYLQYFNSAEYTNVYDGGDTGIMAWNGTGYLSIDERNPGLYIRQVSDVGFSLNSIDLADWVDGTTANRPDGSPHGIPITITGYFVNGGSISQTFTFDADLNRDMQTGNDFTNFTLTGFNNIISAYVSYDGGYMLGIDNIYVSPVPEPEAYAMLLAGLGFIGLMGRRRGKNARYDLAIL